jgi:hypothetical protein
MRGRLRHSACRLIRTDRFAVCCGRTGLIFPGADALKPCNEKTVGATVLQRRSDA